MGQQPVKTQTTTVTTTKWYSALLTPQTFVMVMGGLIAVTLFWFKTEDNWKKTATKADAEDLKILQERVQNLEERVTRQYATQRESNEKTDQKVEGALYWQHAWDGYWKGLNQKDAK